jgi:uncharacterized protein (TIGR00106 family)
MGKEASISPVIARIMKIVIESKVAHKVNPMGTVLEGDWDTVMNVIKKCHEAAQQDAERVLTRISIDDRKGREQGIEKKLTSVEQKLGTRLKT